METDTHPLVIVPEDLDGASARELIDALNEELSAQYPEEGATHFRLEPSEVDGHQGVFLVAYHAGVAVGCGALRRLSDDTAEVKRMYIAPSVRGRGWGAHLLGALEEQARRLGVKTIVLETGDRQRSAMALYRRHGFEPIAPFGEYVDSPLSVCLAKSLAAPD